MAHTQARNAKLFTQPQRRRSPLVSSPSARLSPPSATAVDSWTSAYLGDLLAERLQPSQITSFPSSKMTPALTYGRHRGPMRSNSRLAAVAVTLYRRDQRWWVPTTLRPRFLKHHGGQICLPGGRVEAGEDVCDAARREFHEELGVECEIARFCGELSTQYVYASDNRVHPVVMIIEAPRQPWSPDPGEVDEVIEIPLQTLLNPRSKTTLIREKQVRIGGQVQDVMSFRAPAFRTDSARTTAHLQATDLELPAAVTPLGSRMIWGATAMMLDQLAQLLLH